MIYATALDFRRALEVRLRARSQAGVPLGWLRKQVAFDRLLARLTAVGPDRWMLKGALALDYRLTGRARTSKDMDLAHRGGHAEATADLRSAAALDLGDFFRFDVARTSRLDEVLAGAAVRYHLDCRLGRSLFDASTIDVGFTDPLDLVAEVLSGPPLLEFAGIAPAAVPALPLADHVAQKLHAWASRYGHTAQLSIRTKDLADLVVMAESFEFQAAELRTALERTFAARGTSLPETLPRLPGTWRRDYREVAARLGLGSDVEEARRTVASFLDPILHPTSPVRRWDPRRRRWLE